MVMNLEACCQSRVPNAGGSPAKSWLAKAGSALKDVNSGYKPAHSECRDACCS